MKQDNTEIDRAISWIADLNEAHTKWATDLFIIYIRFRANIQPSGEGSQRYFALLTAPEWRNLRASMLASGSWPNPSFEMYMHFVKLAAYGASDDMIAQAYTTITTTPPTLDPSAFRDITPGTWRNFSGWRSSSMLAPSDLAAQNINDSDRIYFFTTHPINNWYDESLALRFIKDTGYFKAAPVSCFKGTTLVVLADGSNTKRIDAIEPGEVVLSSSLHLDMESSEPLPRTVAFVSRTPRAGRNLYALKGSDVWFTETHPIVTGSAGFSFVNSDLAASVNPSWHSIQTRVLSRDALETPRAQMEAHENEELYDLVFSHADSNSLLEDVPTYFVRSTPTSANIEVGSEAPIARWFPYASIFLKQVIVQITVYLQQPVMASSSVDKKQVVELLSARADSMRSSTNLFTLFGKVRDELSSHYTPASILSNDAIDRGPDARHEFCAPRSQSVEVQHVLVSEGLPSADISSDDTNLNALLIEHLVGRLGRMLADELHIGWAYLDQRIQALPAPHSDVSGSSQDEVSERVAVLFVHSLRFLSNSQSALHITKIAVEVSSCVSTLAGTLEMTNAYPEGTHTSQMQRAITINSDSSADEPPQVPLPKTGELFALKVAIETNDHQRSTYRARTVLSTGLPAQVMLIRDFNSAPIEERPVELDIAVLGCKIDVIPRSALVREKMWSYNVGNCVETYASALGKQFGQELIQELVQK